MLHNLFENRPGSGDLFRPPPHAADKKLSMIKKNLVPTIPPTSASVRKWNAMAFSAVLVGNHAVPLFAIAFTCLLNVYEWFSLVVVGYSFQ